MVQPSEYRALAFDAHGPECDECGSVSDLHVHHKDGNRENNDPRNLRVLCEDCHWDIHGDELAARSRGPTGEAGDIVTGEMTADDALSELMAEGRVTPAYAAEVTGYKKSYVRQKLSNMVKHGHAQKVYKGLYELTTDPERGETDV